jgi:amidase
VHVHDLDATAQAELVRNGTTSPEELVDHAIERIEKHNAELGAVIYPMFEQARADAKHALPGPFRGVPILIKDICALVAGVPYTAGMLPLKNAGFKPPVDSHLVTQLKRAGFVVVGKSNTSELGILPAAENPAWPPTKNPYDTARSSGGSSGGSSSAVAAGLVPIAHANDGGGSIRIPASCCGLYGLKPSRGRVSLAPHLGDVNGGLVSEHVVTRSVRDSAAVLDALAGPVSGDPYSAPPQLRPYLAELAAPTGRLKIGFYTKHPALDTSLVESHPDCVAAVAHTAKLLEGLGHHVEEAFPAGFHHPEWTSRFLTLWTSGVTYSIDSISRQLGRPIEEHEVEGLTWALSELGRMMKASAYVDAWQWIQLNTRETSKFWERYDLWLTPTVAEPPVPLGTFKSPPDDPLAGIFRAADFTPFTPPFNATGQPACSLPLYRNAAGLPIGTQLVAAMGREDLLLQISAQLEAAQPFTHPATRA